MQDEDFFRIFADCTDTRKSIGNGEKEEQYGRRGSPERLYTDKSPFQ